MMPTARLVPYARNARTHSDQQIAQIATSMAEFGFVNPILIGDDNVIIAGHGRLMAAQWLGMSEAPVIVLGYLTAAQRRALVVSRMWWKLPSSGLRACNDGSSQAARSRDIGSSG